MNFLSVLCSVSLNVIHLLRTGLHLSGLLLITEMGYRHFCHVHEVLRTSDLTTSHCIKSRLDSVILNGHKCP